jgi:hypothetical protein
MQAKRLSTKAEVSPPLPPVVHGLGAARSHGRRTDEVCCCPTSTLPVVGSSADRLPGVPNGQSLFTVV